MEVRGSGGLRKGRDLGSGSEGPAGAVLELEWTGMLGARGRGGRLDSPRQVLSSATFCLVRF